MNNKELINKIQESIQQRKASRHKVRLIISGVVGLIVMVVYSQQRPSTQRNINLVDSLNSPLTYCGDKTAGGANTWYPVYIAYSEENLRIIRQSFCCDAFYDPSVDMIQIASFYNRLKAAQLVASLKARNLKSTWIGEGQVVITSPSSRRTNCR